MSRLGLMKLGLAQFAVPSPKGGATIQNTPLVPQLEARISLPKMLDQGFSSRSRLNRIHTRAVRHALLETIRKHHRKRIPQHFDSWKQKKYRYMRRSEETRRRKQGRKNAGADLVKTGRTKRTMKRRMTTRVSGTAAGGEVKATGTLRWPPGMRFPNSGTINRAIMTLEIIAITSQEQAEIENDFLKFYLDFIQEQLSSRRVTREMKAHVKSKLGITL